VKLLEGVVPVPFAPSDRLGAVIHWSD
jgi:hypothetical protein